MGSIPSIDATLLDVMPDMPDAMVSANLVPLAVGDGMDRPLFTMARRVVRGLDGSEREGAQAAFRTLRSSTGFHEWHAAWLKRSDLEVRLGKPPVPGSRLLRPLSTTSELKAEARLMENCLDDLIGEALVFRL